GIFCGLPVMPALQGVATLQYIEIIANLDVDLCAVLPLHNVEPGLLRIATCNDLKLLLRSECVIFGPRLYPDQTRLLKLVLDAQFAREISHSETAPHSTDRRACGSRRVPIPPRSRPCRPPSIRSRAPIWRSSKRTGGESLSAADNRGPDPDPGHCV